MTAGRKRRRLAKLHAQNPDCPVCDVTTQLIDYRKQKKAYPPDGAVLKRFFSKHSGRRVFSTDGVPKTLLMCHACASRLGNEEYNATVPLDERRRRAHPDEWTRRTRKRLKQIRKKT